MRKSIKLTDFGYIAHTEQDIRAIIQTSVFCVDNIFFPGLVTDVGKSLSIIGQAYSRLALGNV